MEIEEVINELNHEKQILNDMILELEWNKSNMKSLYEIVNTIKEIDITIKNIKSSKFRLQTSKAYNYYVSLEELKKRDAQ